MLAMSLFENDPKTSYHLTLLRCAINLDSSLLLLVDMKCRIIEKIKTSLPNSDQAYNKRLDIIMLNCTVSFDTSTWRIRKPITIVMLKWLRTELNTRLKCRFSQSLRMSSLPTRQPSATVSTKMGTNNKIMAWVMR